MSALLNGGSRQWRRRVQGRTLLILIAITFALLNTGSTHGVAKQLTCNTNIVITDSETTASVSVDCDTAEYKAIQKAQQAIRNQAAGITCPQACPTLTEVRPWPITYVDCPTVQVNGSTRYNGIATVQGIYRCQ